MNSQLNKHEPNRPFCSLGKENSVFVFVFVDREPYMSVLSKTARKPSTKRPLYPGQFVWVLDQRPHKSAKLSRRERNGRYRGCLHDDGAALEEATEQGTIDLDMERFASNVLLSANCIG